MNLVKAVQSRLEKMERNTLWLSKASGVPKTSLYSFMQGKTTLDWNNMQLVANGLGIKLSTLVKEAEGK